MNRSARPGHRSIARFQVGGSIGDYWDLGSRLGLALLDRIVGQQAQIIAYIDVFKPTMLTTLLAILLLLLICRPTAVRSAGFDETHAIVD